jgi:hypothetical protein
MDKQDGQDILFDFIDTSDLPGMSIKPRVRVTGQLNGNAGLSAAQENANQ